MAKLQTSADIGGQAFRKSLDFSAGVAAGFGLARGIITEDIVNAAVIIVPALVTLAGSFTWWKKAQETVMTVEGLRESNLPGSATAAATAAKVVAEAVAEKANEGT